MKLYLQQLKSVHKDDFWYKTERYLFYFDNDLGSSHRTQIRKNL